MYDEFYRYNQIKPCGQVPITRICNKIDSLTAANDIPNAVKVISYWIEEAVAVNDKLGEIFLYNELLPLCLISKDLENAEKTIQKITKIIESEFPEKNFSAVYKNICYYYSAIGNDEKANAFSERLK